MAWSLRDKVAIVGMGHTGYTRPGASGRTALSLALEAAMNACADAGISPRQLEGFVTYSGESSDPYTMAHSLGVPEVRFMDRYSGGGESLAGTVHHAAHAIAAGTASFVMCYRSLSGKLIRTQAGAKITEAEPVGTGGGGGFRPDFLHPFGAFIPNQFYAMQARRHMIDFSTTSRQFGAIAVNQNKNAQRNPNAIHYGRPITIEDHQNSRMVADPYHLYDCTQEADGAGAVIVTAVERANDLKQQPVHLLAAAEGAAPAKNDMLYNQMRHQGRWNTVGMEEVARDLYARATIGPSGIDVAQIFETFSGQALIALEDFGFCERGEGGPFVESGAINWETGSLPMNTAGGGLAEGYIHGFNNLLEGVRQMRGESTSQVKDAQTCIVTSGPSAMPSSALILRR